MKAKNIEEFFGTLQQATVEAWKEHLKTDKYSKHIALNDFYEDVVELVDTLIEDYMGIYGKVSDYKNIMTTEKIGAVEYLESLREMCKEAADDLFDEDEKEFNESKGYTEKNSSKEELTDIQKELEAKFDELFGSIDDDE